LLKSIVKRITLVNSKPTQHLQANSNRKSQFWRLTPEMLFLALSSVATVLTISQSAFAQLNVGRYGVQPGLESEYLQYQISGQDLSQMRGISGCFVGFGLSCNKTGSILNQLLESNHRLSSENLLIRAAGGQENLNNFAQFYGNNPNITKIPFASFWQNDSPSIMDGYRYVLGLDGPLTRTPVEGLGTVTKNFYWSPLSGTGADNALNLRSGLLDLKYSYGRLMLEEVSKIPNIEQQIQALGFSPEITKFYIANLSKGLNALDTGNSAQIQDSILHILSSPYSPGGGEFKRPNIGIPKEFGEVYGQGLPGDEFVADKPIFLDGDVTNLDVPRNVGEYFAPPEAGAGHGVPGWLLGLGGAGLLGLILLLAGGGGGHSSSGSGGSSGFGSGGGLGGGGSISLGGGGGPSGTGPTVGIGPGGGGTTVTGTQQIPESSMLSSLVLIMIVIWILSYRHRRFQAKG